MSFRYFDNYKRGSLFTFGNQGGIFSSHLVFGLELMQVFCEAVFFLLLDIALDWFLFLAFCALYYTGTETLRWLN